CAGGPAPLPQPQLHEKYEHTYVAVGGETIAEVAAKFGFDDPSPLNHPSYGYALKMRLRHQDRIFLPYTQSTLSEMIEVSHHMIESAAEEAEKLIEAQNLQQEEFEGFLLTIEAISILANVGAGLVQGSRMAMHGLKHVVTREAEVAAGVAAGK